MRPSKLILTIASLQNIFDPRKPVMIIGPPSGKIIKVTVSGSGHLVILYKPVRLRKKIK